MCCGFCRIRGRAPFTNNLINGLHSSPSVVGNHGDAIGDWNNRLHTAHVFRVVCIKANHRPTFARVGADSRIDHAVQVEIDPERLRACCLGNGVGAHHRFTDVAPFRRVAQGNVGDRRNLGRFCSEVYIGDGFTIGQNNRRIRCSKGRNRHARSQARCGLNCLAGHSTGHP